MFMQRFNKTDEHGHSVISRTKNGYCIAQANIRYIPIAASGDVHETTINVVIQ